jgi:hypothetical protein
MSEYVSKKAVLEWLKEQQKHQEENRDRVEIDHPYWEYHEGASDYLSLAVEKIESGAFDADNNEVQRLRSMLEALILRNAFKAIDEPPSTTTCRVCDGSGKVYNYIGEYYYTCPQCFTTESTGAKRVRELWALNNEEGNRADEEYLSGIVDTLNALGYRIPGINAPEKEDEFE